MNLTYSLDKRPTTAQIIDLYTNAGLPRPTHDAERMAAMYAHSNLVVSAWHGDVLVGISRSITDWVWSCYLADLAVRSDYQAQGIGKKLVGLTKNRVGHECMVLLLSVPEAMEYYPRIGMQKVHNGFILHRDG